MELVMVIVILGIIGVLGADFIGKGFKGFHDTENRAAMFEEGSLAMTRMEREIHNAIPNAVDIASSTDLRFGMIDEAAMDRIFGQYTETNPTGTTQITDNDPTPLVTGLPADAIISIYNRKWEDFSTRLYALDSTYAANTNPLILDSTKPIIDSSPRRRYYVVDKVIRYQLDTVTNTLFRAEDAVSKNGPGDFSTSTNYPLAKNVTLTNNSNLFTYTPGTLNRNGVVSINFTLKRGGEEVSFHKEVHIFNVP